MKTEQERYTVVPCGSKKELLAQMLYRGFPQRFVFSEGVKPKRKKRKE